MEKFNSSTVFRNNTYYTFDKNCLDIYLSQTVSASERKYFTISSMNLNTENQTFNTAFYLKNLENVTLDFEGAVITLHGKIQPFIIDNCSDITIKNVTVAYDRSHYTELDIIKHVGNKLYTKPKAKFPCRVENGYFIPYSENWEDRNIHSDGCLFMQAYDKETREGTGLTVIYLGEEITEHESPPIDNIPHIKVRSEGDNIVFIGDIPENFDEKSSIVLEHNHERKISSAAVYHSKNITFDNYRILNGGGMGLYSMYTENISVKSYKLINDELSHGVVSNSADGIHFVATKGKIEITDSIFEGTIDDALNIHSIFHYVEKAENNVIYVRRSDKSHALGVYADMFGIGDEIALYNGFTLEEKKRFVITEKEFINDWLMKIILDKDSAGIYTNDLIENLSTNAEVVIKNSRFAKANSHLRLQTRGKITVENCDFTLPILLTGDTTYWFESSPVKDITIKNCRFCGNRGMIRIIPEFIPTENAPCYHSGIKIIDNAFDCKTPLESHRAKDILFKNNKISDGSDPLLILDNCINVNT